MRDETSQEKEVRRGVRFNQIALAALAVLAAVGAWALLSWLSRPLDGTITPDGSGLVDTLDLESWTVTQKEAEGEPLAVFRLGEDYQLALYEGGLAYVWNGYAPPDTTGAVWYTIPEGTAQAAADLLKTDGQVETNPPERF